VASLPIWRAPALPEILERPFSFRRESCAAEGRYQFHADPPDAFDWLKPHPMTARIGASLRLYHLPEP